MTLHVTVRHRLGDFQLDVDVQMPTGITALFGRSGAGKTSLVSAIAGLTRPRSARIALDQTVFVDTSAGRFLPPHRRQVGCVFQDGRLFPHLTVRQNLLYGHWMRAGLTAPGRELDRLVDLLGLEALLAQGVAGLSGGERQRVALGRALLMQPRLLLADEPLAALDGPRKADILPYFERLRDEVGIPIVYVSHSATEVARLADQVIVLEGGRVIGQGAPGAVFAEPAFLPEPAGDMSSVIEASVVAHHSDGLTELVAGGLPLFLAGHVGATGTAVRVRIVADDVLLSGQPPSGVSALNILAGTVSDVREGEAAGAIVRVETAAGPIMARLTRRSVAALELAPGRACHAIIKTLAIARSDRLAQPGVAHRDDLG